MRARTSAEQTALYGLVQQHAPTFIAETVPAAGAELPQFAKVEFDVFPDCTAATAATTSSSPSVASDATFARRAAYGSDCGASCQPRRSPRAGAPFGSVTADPATPFSVDSLGSSAIGRSFTVAIQMIVSARPWDGLFGMHEPFCARLDGSRVGSHPRSSMRRKHSHCCTAA